MKRAVSFALLVIAVLLFGCSLLAIFSAPTSWLWIASILIGEWGHFAAVGLLIFASIGWQVGGITRAASVFAVMAAALCISPALRAAKIAQSLPAQCNAAFGQAAAGLRTQPLAWLDLFRGVPISQVDVSEHVYAQDGNKSLELDLYRPHHSPGELPPLIVMVHGGSWKGGSKSELPALNRFLAQTRFAVASINYRHAPKNQFPAAVDDVFRAIDFLKANAPKLRVDANRIVLMGRSAGGQIALSAAYAQREPAVRGVISFYAPADLVVGYNKPSRPWVLNSKKVLEDYLGGSPGEKPETYAAASPINFVSSATPPTLLIHGELDPMVWSVHSDLLSSRLRKTQRPHLYLRLPWATHGCEANLSGPSGQLSLYAIDRFLAAAFRDRSVKSESL